MNRFATAFESELHIDIGPRSISMTLTRKHDYEVFSGTRSTNAVGVNFKIISGISRLSWTVTENTWSAGQIRDELNRLIKLPQYPRLIVLLVVALAGAAFCYTFGGSWIEMAIAFGATFCGLFVKQELSIKSFNTYFCTYVSASIAALFVGLFYSGGAGFRLENAFTTSVLFLIPGVPLINSFTDLIDGEILNGVDRGVNALIHALAIAFGLSTVMFILNFQN